MREPITMTGPDPITVALVIIALVGAALIVAALIRRGPLCALCHRPAWRDNPTRVEAARHVHWFCGTCSDRLRSSRAGVIPDWTPEMLARLDADLRKEGS